MAAYGALLCCAIGGCEGLDKGGSLKLHCAVETCGGFAGGGGWGCRRVSEGYVGLSRVVEILFGVVEVVRGCVSMEECRRVC